MLTNDVYRLLALPTKCLCCAERDVAPKCSFNCEPIPLTEVVEDDLHV